MDSPATAHAGNPRLRLSDLFNAPPIATPYKSMAYIIVHAAGHE